MSYANLLFGFKGRINRQRFWVVSILAGCALTAVVVLLALAAKYTGHLAVDPETQRIAPTGVFAILIGAFYVVNVWIGLALSIKRLHDRNHRGWWLLAQVIPFLAWIVLFAVALSMPDEERMIVYVAAAACGVASIGIALWLLVQIGLLQGTSGPNRFGPDPLDIPPPSRDQ